MGKILENLIKKEINKAFSFLEKKLVEQKDNPTQNPPETDIETDTDLTSLLSNEPKEGNPELSAPPQMDDLSMGSPSDSSGTDLSNPEQPETNPEMDNKDNAEKKEEEMEKDPITASFDNLKDLSGKTQDITKIVKMIKATIQDNFDDFQKVGELVQKIEQEGTTLMKRALKRPELSFLTNKSI